MSLFPPEKFESIASILANSTVIFAPGEEGIAGQMINSATKYLFKLWGVNVCNDWRNGDYPECSDGADYFVYGGGGSIGNALKQELSTQRRWLVGRYASKEGLPLVVLPQSIGMDSETRPDNLTIFCREAASQALAPGSLLAPDLALVLPFEGKYNKPIYDSGIFLREDGESRMAKYWKNHLGDPIRYASSWEDYLVLAAQFRKITTDRLHFAICGLMLGRDIILLPDAYHKNRSMHECWLKELGCKFHEVKL
jgi:exopolysaccharide biosynthesis predicted pyruvyltransferase EpsI